MVAGVGQRKPFRFHHPDYRIIRPNGKIGKRGNQSDFIIRFHWIVPPISKIVKRGSHGWEWVRMDRRTGVFGLVISLCGRGKSGMEHVARYSVVSSTPCANNNLEWASLPNTQWFSQKGGRTLQDAFRKSNAWCWPTLKSHTYDRLRYLMIPYDTLRPASVGQRSWAVTPNGKVIKSGNYGREWGEWVVGLAYAFSQHGIRCTLFHFCHRHLVRITR